MVMAEVEREVQILQVVAQILEPRVLRIVEVEVEVVLHQQVTLAAMVALASSSSRF